MNNRLTPCTFTFNLSFLPFFFKLTIHSLSDTACAPLDGFFVWTSNAIYELKQTVHTIFAITYYFLTHLSETSRGDFLSICGVGP